MFSANMQVKPSLLKEVINPCQTPAHPALYSEAVKKGALPDYWGT